jgi:hypothetical protein
MVTLGQQRTVCTLYIGAHVQQTVQPQVYTAHVSMLLHI